MLYCDPKVSGGRVIMTYFELEMLAKLIQDDAITKAQRSRFTRNMKKLRSVSSNEQRTMRIRDQRRDTLPVLKKQCVVLEGGSDG